MTSFRKFWLPAIILTVFLSHLPFFPEPEEITQKQLTHEIKKVIVSPPKIPENIQKDALTLTKNASKETGVRPEYLYAIYDQETSRGENFGSCYIFDPKLFGKGVGVNLRSGKFSSRIMKAERDVEPFFAIMEELGRNPYFTAVSCPMENIGYGGGMGHMQFIPSTWIRVKDRVAIALGKKIADPWNFEDAIYAAAFHLKDCGAIYGKISAERNASCRYFSGKPCGEKKLVTTKTKRGKIKKKIVYVENRIIASYGNSIVKKTMHFKKKFWPETVVAKADTKAKHKKTHDSKKQELVKDFEKQKKKNT
jgi:membrane-bound lytic murein transglycosylase B